MRVTVGELAARVGGTVVGDASVVLTGISSLAEAKPGDVSFLANAKYAPWLRETKATAVLLAKPEEGAQLVQVVVANPDLAFAQVVEAYGPRARALAPGIHPTAVIGDGVQIGADPAIGPYAVIGAGTVIGDGARIHAHAVIGPDCRVGANCLIHPLVTIREACRLGDRVIVHSGTVIGSDGFGYASVQGVHHKIPQVGIVVVGDDVEIGANTTIDRARFGKTVIGAGTKIDNLVQIAHNVEIGEHAIIVAQVGVAGSTRIGRHVTLAGQCGLAGHLQIGDQAVVAGQSGVSKNVPPRTVVQGSPAQEMKVHQAKEVAVRRLPKALQAIKELQARLAELERRLETSPESPS